ncbi:MAG: hypothetical protein ACFCU2_11955 [Acidimicrobiia bacterium]
MSKKLVTILALVVVTLLLLVIAGALLIPSGSISTSDDGTKSVKLAMLAVPIADETPVLEAPDQYLGVPHPEPEFDTGELGPDLSFRMDTSDLPGLNPDDVLRAVYLGHDTNGEPYYIWHSGSPDFRRMIGQIVADFGAVGRLESSYGTQEIGDAFWDSSREDTIAHSGLTTGSISGSSEGSTFTAEWHGLPKEVVAVALNDRGDPVGWQRPVSGTVAFQLHSEDVAPPSFGFGVEMVAFSVTGEVWNRYLPFPD